MKLGILVLFLLGAVAARAEQTVVIKGTITDSASNEPLRFVTVRAIDARSATVSSKTGEFVLQVPADKLANARKKSTTLRIVFSMVGYQTDTISVKYRSNTVSVQLAARDLRMRDVVVTAEDPGEKIMRRVIAKKTAQQDSLDRYTYSLYTKLVLITDTLTAQRSTGNTDSTIFSILESYSRGYVDLPDQHFNEILQRRQTANVPPQANFVAFGTNLNIYEDNITILGEEIETPFNTDAVEDYDFVLESDEADSIVKISVTPSGGGFKGFNGVAFINQRTNQPLEVRLTPNKAVNLPFDATMEIRQTFTTINGITMPEALSIVSLIDIEILWSFRVRLDVDLETFCYDYDFETPFSSDVFDQRRVEVSEQASAYDSTFWNENMKIALRPEEEYAYGEIARFQESADSIEGGIFDNWLGVIATGYRALGREPFSTQNDVFRYNSIHGPYLGLGSQWRPDTTIEVRATAGYGFNNNRWYGSAGATYFLGEFQKWSVEADVFSVLNRRDNAFLVKQPLITTTSLLFGDDYGDYYNADGWQTGIGYSWGQFRFLRIGRWARANSVRLLFREERQTNALTRPMWSLFGNDGERRTNPAILPGTTRSINAEIFLQYRPERRLERSGMYLLAELSDPTIVQTDFDYTRIDWVGFYRMRTWPLFVLDISVGLGWSTGYIPPQKFFSLESAISGIAVGSAFRVMNVKEFYGDRYASLSLSHNWGEVIPGLLRIPNVAALGIEFITFGSVGWSAFRSSTLKFTSTTLPTTEGTREDVYVEAGIGINRILLFLRTDINARFSQRHNPQFVLTITAATF